MKRVGEERKGGCALFVTEIITSGYDSNKKVKREESFLLDVYV